MDYSYEQAYRDMLWWRCSGHEGVMQMFDDGVNDARRKYAETAHLPTEEEMHTAALREKAIRDDIRSNGGSGDVSPQIANWYKQGAEKQREADSLFSVKGSRAGVKVNSDDSLSFMQCNYLTAQQAADIASVAFQLASLLHAEKTHQTVGVSPEVRAQFMRMRGR